MEARSRPGNGRQDKSWPTAAMGARTCPGLRRQWAPGLVLAYGGNGRQDLSWPTVVVTTSNERTQSAGVSTNVMVKFLTTLAFHDLLRFLGNASAGSAGDDTFSNGRFD